MKLLAVRFYVIDHSVIKGEFFAMHAIGFVDTTPEGMHGKEFTFYHRVVNDVESYRQQLHGSIPLYPFEKDLQPNDTLRFIVNLYDKGLTAYDFIQ